MDMMQKFNTFVETMVSEQRQFETMQNDVERCEKNVEQLIMNLNDQIQQLVNNSKNEMSDNEDEEIIKIFDNSSQSLITTIANVNEKIREAIKGMTFIQDFEKRFTVAVFGKVKAGKSYIGNFIMGNPIKRMGLKSAYDEIGNIVVAVYDRGNLSTQETLSEQPDELNGFATGMKETTSTIQWFNLGGMCWFDTPGIGSVTWENEMLAKEYVKNADLVIFACNSDAAGTRQEFAEMKQLYDMQKPILLLLTQSDAYMFDIDDDGEEISVLGPKTDKDRLDTEQYMVETFKEQGMEDALKYETLTVSAKLAVEALDNDDEELFKQSNMGLFLDKLVAITENDASEIKKATPRKRLDEMIDGIIDDLHEMASQISYDCDSIKKSKEKLISKKDDIFEQVKSQTHLKMIEILQESKMKVEQNQETVSEDELSQKINKAIAECIHRVCTDAAIQASNNMKNLRIELKGIGNMQMRTDSIAYEYTYVVDERRDARNPVEWIGEKVLKKEYFTSVTRTKTKYSTFDIGVNDAEIAQNIMLQLGDVFRTTVAEYIQMIVEGYYTPIEELERKSVQAIKYTVSQINNLKI